MRLSGLVLFVVFQAPALLAHDATQFDQPLQKDVEEIAAHHQGSLTLYAIDVKTGRTVGIEPDRKVKTASVIKLAVLFDALQQIRSGQVHFNDRLTLKKEDQVPGAGLLLFFDVPEQITFKDALTLMIVMSDNTAANLVIDHLGLPAINQSIAALGLRDTYLYNKVFAHEAAPIPAEREPDHKKFGLGSTTAREMATVMHRIYACRLGSSDDPVTDSDRMLCHVALTMLGNQFYRDCIPRYLDAWNAPGTGSGPAIGNKTGSLDQVRNDVGVVSAFRGPILISTFTFDNSDQSWQVDNKAEITIAKLAKAIVSAWSPEGLSPKDYNPDPQSRSVSGR